MPDLKNRKPALLSWCSPSQAHFWNREEPNCEGCPYLLGDVYYCSCPHHEGKTVWPTKKVVRRRKKK